MKTVINDLIDYEHNFNEAVFRWEAFARHIREFCKDYKLRAGAMVKPPAPEEGKIPHSIEISFAGVKLVCQCCSFENVSVLLFGYMKRKSVNRDKFVVTNKVYIDKPGNILESKNGDPTDQHLLDGESVEGVFFEGCKKALQVAWKKI